MDNENKFENIADGAPIREKRRGAPIWTIVVCVVLAALIAFCSTYVFLTDKYNTSLHELELRGIDISKDPAIKFDSAVSPALAEMYALIDEISELFENNYILKADYEAAAKKIVSDYMTATGDKYAYYYTAEEWAKEEAASNGNSVGIGMYVEPYESESRGEFVITYVMNDTPAQKAGLEAGDIIVGIDGQSISNISYYDAVALCSGTVGTTVVLNVVRNGENMTFTAVRDNYEVETIISNMYEVGGHKIGYIRIIQFYLVTVDQFEEALDSLRANGCEGIIFDVRSNPGGALYAVYHILDYLLPSGPVVKLTYVDGKSYTFRSDAKCVSKMPMVVLTNENTASAAELFTAGLRDYDYATIVGTKTYGKGCGQSEYELSNGGCVYITSFWYDPPYSENYNGVGIYPDIEVEADEELAIKKVFIIDTEKDNQFKAAVDEILKKINE